MYRVAICDDNTAEGQHVLELTRRVLCERNIDAAFSLFADPGKLLTDIQEEHHRYDLLLLDMLFDKTNGIHIAKTLRDMGEQVPIIYTTISQDYAIDGYKVQASDYLIKPIELTPLAEAIDRILGRRDTLWVKSDGIPKQISVSDIQKENIGLRRKGDPSLSEGSPLIIL